MKRLVAYIIFVITITAVVDSANFDLSRAQQISPEQTSQMCNPNNPKLNFVNSTESEICGIPESVKNQTILDDYMRHSLFDNTFCGATIININQ